MKHESILEANRPMCPVCSSFGENDIQAKIRLVSGHHPTCARFGVYVLMKRMLKLVGQLVTGIELEASQGDGIANETYPAYLDAKLILGEPVKQVEDGVPVAEESAAGCETFGFETALIHLKAGKKIGKKSYPDYVYLSLVKEDDDCYYLFYHRWDEKTRLDDVGPEVIFSEDFYIKEG